MKKILLLILLLVAIAPVDAKLTIYDYLQNVDEYYFLVLGDQSPATDSNAALDIALGIQTYNSGLQIKSVLESEISANASKILVGHPCENSLINLPCEEWPYEDGVGVIKVDKTDLIVSGTTPDDRRRAAKILQDYPNYLELQEDFFILVKGNTLIVQELTLEVAKAPSEFICGDGLCESGEKFLCIIDCQQTSCNDVCGEGNYVSAACEQITDPNQPICKEGWINKGQQYCTNNRFCCCEEKSEAPIPKEEIVEEVIPKEESKAWIIGVVGALLAILLVGYLLLR